MTPASIIQDTLADAFKMNTPEAWARFGERVVEALKQAELHVVHRPVVKKRACGLEFVVNPLGKSDLWIIWIGPLAPSEPEPSELMVREFGYRIAKSLCLVGIDTPSKARARENRPLFDNIVAEANQAERQETDALIDELIETCIASENEWSTDIVAMEREEGPVLIQIRGTTPDLHLKGHPHGLFVKLEDGAYVGPSYIRCWRRAA
jgi:hypothetical protein